MAEITKELGRIPVSRGDYQATVEYYKDNIVQYKRGSYQVVSESPIIGIPPTNDKNIVNPGWTLFAGTLDAQDVVNQVKDQETKSIQAVAAREAEILAKSDAAEVSFDNTGTSLSRTNVQDVLKETNDKLTELEREIGSFNQNTQENGLYVCNEKGEVIIRLDVLDTNNSIGEKLANTIVELIKSNDFIKNNNVLEDGFYVCNDKGEYIVSFKNGKWDFANNDIINEDSFEEGFHLCGNDGKIFAQYTGEKWRFAGDMNPYSSRSKVFGIKINNKNGRVERVGDAVGLSTMYKIGDNFVGKTNDFDSIFPWCEMKLCNVKVENGKKIITYENESEFTRDGSNGEVMVEIPKFYTLRRMDKDYDTICISGEKLSGFVCEPAFHDSVTGEEIDYIYVGAYQSNIESGNQTSRSGINPTTQKNLLEFRKAGEMYDYATLSAIQKLFIIEFGVIDSSWIFGGLGLLPFNYFVYAFENKTTPVNGAIFYSTEFQEIPQVFNIENLFVGATITVSKNTTTVENRIVTKLGTPERTTLNGIKICKRYVEFSGEPIAITSNPTANNDYNSSDYINSTKLYCTAQKNGLTDNIGYHTGRAGLNKTTIADQFKYRGIEGLWGNTGEYVDGIRIKNLDFYYSIIKEDYDDLSKYTKLSYKSPRHVNYDDLTYVTSVAMVRSMGFDKNHPTVNMPFKISEDGLGTDRGYYGDFFCANDRQDVQYVCILSMAWDGFYRNGLFMYRFWHDENWRAELYGSRMIYRNV